ncbi:hypothetical protein BC943DRAFT_331841 [Umbelopsis sp. AD052]|nr:hypothetical protein BC943DRAFT_331841 [Umbelopsis sp. AD052]
MPDFSTVFCSWPFIISCLQRHGLSSPVLGNILLDTPSMYAYHEDVFHFLCILFIGNRE